MHLSKMQHFTGTPIPLWPAGKTPLFNAEIPQPEPALYPYLLKDRPEAGLVIVCPGGGYTQKVYHESEPIAMKLNELGFHAVILDYRVVPYSFPAPLLDLQRAIRLVRSMVGELGFNGKVATIGFSAGGHLCGMGMTLFDYGQADACDPVERLSCRPDAALLCYAPRAQGYASRLGGGEAPLEMQRKMMVDANVRDDTPPVFIMHTCQDQKVPVECALILAEALTKRNVPVSMHLYPFGPHGASLRKGYGLAEDWINQAALFLREFGF